MKDLKAKLQKSIADIRDKKGFQKSYYFVADELEEVLKNWDSKRYLNKVSRNEGESGNKYSKEAEFYATKRLNELSGHSEAALWWAKDSKDQLCYLWFKYDDIRNGKYTHMPYGKEWRQLSTDFKNAIARALKAEGIIK